jgi:hypothetical protein
VVRLIPREEKYFELLNDLIGRISSGANLFVELLADYEGRAGYAEKIKAIEKECDRLVADVVVKLNKSFITPIDSEDIYVDDPGRRHHRCGQRAGVAPSRSSTPFHFGPTYPRSPDPRRVDGGGRAGIRPPRGASRRHRARAQGSCAGEGADTLYAEAIHRLFTQEPDAIEVIKLVPIYEQLEDAIDRSKHLAQTLEGIVVKHS